MVRKEYELKERTSKPGKEKREISRSSILFIAQLADSHKRYLLLIQRSEGKRAGEWELPGGEVEGDDIVLSAVKEIFQETGIKVSPESLFQLPFTATGDIYSKSADIEVVNKQLVYTTTVTSLPKIELSGEHRSYMWLSYPIKLPLDGSSSNWSGSFFLESANTNPVKESLCQGELLSKIEGYTRVLLSDLTRTALSRFDTYEIIQENRG